MDLSFQDKENELKIRYFVAKIFSRNLFFRFLERPVSQIFLGISKVDFRYITGIFQVYLSYVIDHMHSLSKSKAYLRNISSISQVHLRYILSLSCVYCQNPTKLNSTQLNPKQL